MGLESFDIDGVMQSIHEKNVDLKTLVRDKGNDFSLRASGSVKYVSGFNLSFSLEFKSGTITAIVGKNGSGKSTMFKGMVGWMDDVHTAISNITLETPDQTIKENNIANRGRIVGYLPQSFDLMLINRTVKQELHYSNKVRGTNDMVSEINRIAELFTLNEYMNRDPLMLSQGQRRRVAMAATIAGGPRIIMLDEPTSGQDYYHKKNLGEEIGILKRAGFTIILISHDMRFVFKYADRIIVMDGGNAVADGTPEEIFEKSEVYGLRPPVEFTMRRGILNV